MTEQIELCYRQFGLRVEQLRISLGWTQLELSKKVELERTSVCNIEIGRQRVNLHTVEKFSTAFGVSPKHLMKGIWT